MSSDIELMTNLYNKNKHITLIANNDIFYILINQIIQNAIAENKWHNLYPLVEHINWQDIK